MRKENFELVLATLLAFTPVLVLTLKGGVSTILFVSFILSVFLTRRDMYRDFYSQNKTISFIFFTPIISTGISQILRHQLVLEEFDSPSRFLLAYPILVAIYKSKFDFFKLFNFTLPLATILTAIITVSNPSLQYSDARLTNHFVDPLTFGAISLTLGVWCFALIPVSKNQPFFCVLYKIIGGSVGLYLSIKSGSRTGWPSMPFVLICFFLATTGNKLPIMIRCFLLPTLTILLCTLFYELNSTIHERVNILIQEITKYKWNEMNIITSTSERISFFRIALSLFLKHPFSGWGDVEYKYYTNLAEFSLYASQFTRDSVYAVGFHSDIAAQLVRSGVFGLLSYLYIIIAPFLYFYKYFKHTTSLDSSFKIALCGILFIIVVFISGLSYEFFFFKFFSSFYAITIAVCIGQLIRYKS